jgi:Pyruvate/2-oxoacid:ferredoxin oxidoreductase delta subunit
MNRKEYADAFLEKRIERYDRWLDKGLISFSSRVIPVRRSLEARQWILPAEQVREVLRSAAVIALQPCECREGYRRCDHPRDVCLLFDEVAEKLLLRNEARRINIEEAFKVLERADRSGLVHLSLYMPNHKIYALCSCCPCCCHEMQIVRAYGRHDLMVRSQYVAETDDSHCIHCGDCVQRCMFSARGMSGNGELLYDPDRCLGCGLCITVCPANATAMILRETACRHED